MKKRLKRLWKKIRKPVLMVWAVIRWILAIATIILVIAIIIKIIVAFFEALEHRR